MKPCELQAAGQENRSAWNANAVFWDARMGDEGNDFLNVLCWPVILRLLDPGASHRILDIACGNGILTRRLAQISRQVVGFDFSDELIRLAVERTSASLPNITYHMLDASDATALVSKLGEATFDSALCNMALFDMADIEPLFHTLPRLLKPGGLFVFTLTHPAFNNASCVRLAEEKVVQSVNKLVYSVKVSRYMTPYVLHGDAIRNQPQPQLYFERPLTYYFNLAFSCGFIIDGFEERSFPPEHPQDSFLGWGGAFSEIPPVLAVRLRQLQM